MSQLGKSGLVIDSEFWPPIDENILIWIDSTLWVGCYLNQFLFNEQFADKIRPLRRIMENGEVKRALLHALEKSRRGVNVRCYRCFSTIPHASI